MNADIRNFILVYYKRWNLNLPPFAKTPAGWSPDKLSIEQEFCYKAMLAQLKKMYPLATVHVITDEKFEDRGQVVCHHFPDMPKNHNCKFEAFGLLDEPAMFLDNDLVIVRPWEQKHIECAGPINFYRRDTRMIPLAQVADDVPFPEFQRHVGGITYIKNPSKDLVAELKGIRERYFSNQDRMFAARLWMDNEEHTLSFFVRYHSIPMSLWDEINYDRKWLAGFDEIRNYHTVHWTGMDKALFLEEYVKYQKLSIGMV